MSGSDSSFETVGAPESLAAGLDSSAAMVRAEARHLDATLHALVARLRSVPGLRLSVSCRQGTLRRFLGDLPYVNCGAPLSTGELICSHCHTDVRSVVDVPLVVSRLELY